MYLAGLGDFSSNLLIGFGLTSMLVAGIFMVKQTDYKRMLAYSSIENMGVIAFGVGIGGVAVYGAILHMIHHSLIKSSLFLSAGNILLGFQTKFVERIGSLAKFLPKTFVSFFAGFVGIAGLPPFGLFVSELFILIGAIETGHHLYAALFIFCLLLVVAGAAQIVTDMSFSENVVEVHGVEKLLRVFPPYILLLTSLFLTVWMPDQIYATILDTIKIIGGTIHG
jgi:hydrogenase-4 component F